MTTTANRDPLALTELEGRWLDAVRVGTDPVLALDLAGYRCSSAASKAALARKLRRKAAVVAVLGPPQDARRRRRTTPVSVLSPLDRSLLALVIEVALTPGRVLSPFEAEAARALLDALRVVEAARRDQLPSPT